MNGRLNVTDQTAGISWGPDRCFVVQDQDGEPWYEEHVSHFATRERADEVAAEYLKEELDDDLVTEPRVPKVVELDHSCVFGKCVRCDIEFDSSGEGGTHFPSVDVLSVSAFYEDEDVWAVLPSEGLVCGGCLTFEDGLRAAARLPHGVDPDQLPLLDIDAPPLPLDDVLLGAAAVAMSIQERALLAAGEVHGDECDEVLCRVRAAIEGMSAAAKREIERARAQEIDLRYKEVARAKFEAHAAGRDEADRQHARLWAVLIVAGALPNPVEIADRMTERDAARIDRDHLRAVTRIYVPGFNRGDPR